MRPVIEEVRLGVVGLNGYGGTYFGKLAGCEGVRIMAVCDANPEALRSAAERHRIPHAFGNIEDLLASKTTDAVCIATPHFLHHAMILSALRAGQHVFCEKPLTITSVHAHEVVAAAAAAGKILTCHYNQRTRDHIAAMRWAVRSGLLGKVYHINASWMARHTEFMFDAQTTWRQSRAKSGGGIFIGRGSHLIDAALHLLDFPKVETIIATASNALAGYEVDDFAHAVLRITGGATVTVNATYLAHLPGPADRQSWEIYGGEGGARFQVASGQPSLFEVGRCEFPGASWTDLLPKIDQSAARAAAPYSLLHDFVAAVRFNRAPFVAPHEAAFITRLIEAGYDSAASGREVRL